MAFLSKAPHLVVVSPGNTTGNAYLYWSFENGIRRWMYTWVKSYRNGKDEGRHPTLASYDLGAWQRVVAEAARDNHIVLFVDDGWYNIFGDAALDDFAAFGPTCKVYGTVRARSHGTGLANKMFGGGRKPADAPKTPEFIELLKGTAKPDAPSHMLYYVMGANCYRVAHEWPPPSRPVSYYLRADGALSTQSPSEKTVEVVGKLRAELHVSTDVPDTMLVVKLVDVQPDGYEMIVREGAFMTRYRNGLDRPSPVKPGEIVRLAFEFNSTVVAFNPGHRIGVYITSSSTPAYEVHPNTYEPVASYEKSPVAHNAIHLSAEHPSCVILPSVAVTSGDGK